MQRFVSVAFVAAATFVCSCELRELPPCVEEAPEGGPRIERGGDPVILAAGDILDPSSTAGAEATARLLDHMDGIVAVLGDAVHEVGALDDFLDGYARTWGRHRWRTKPAVGNHEYRTPHAGAHFAYFCGTPFEGGYSYEAGTWHVVVLNSNCDDANEDEACAPKPEQLAWLRADLAAHPTACTLA